MGNRSRKLENEFAVFNRKSSECFLNFVAFRSIELVEWCCYEVIFDHSEQRACTLQPLEVA